MEKREEKKRAEHACGLYCPCGRMSVGHLVVKIFLAVALIGLGLVIAMAVFYGLGKSHVMRSCSGVIRSQEAVQGQFMGQAGGGVVMMGGSNMAFRAGDEKLAIPERVFGVITKIEANRITISNNAAQEQVVVSQASTIIISSSTEAGLSSLQVGQKIVILGSPDKDNILTAKMINIQ